MITTSGDLYDLFRSDVVDVEAPYLWSDTEVFAYMGDAYRSFVRNTGGVPDATSAITQIPVVATQPFAEISPLILRFRQAYLVSSGQKITIINDQDIDTLSRAGFGQTGYSQSSYGQSGYGSGQVLQILNDPTPGIVSYMIVGLERGQSAGKVKWLHVPAVNDTVQLTVYRLPLDTIDTGDTDFTFPDIGAEHIEYLVLHMKARAYGKQDSECFDKGKRDNYKAEFSAYCQQATAEWERYKHKTRIVAYGGL